MMKKYKFFAAILSVALLINISSPCAQSINPDDAIISGELSNSNYAIYGLEDDTMRFNILIDTKENIGQFAIVYLEEPDYLYEFSFSLDDINSNDSKLVWENIQSFCFENINAWSEVYVPSVVTIVDTAEAPPVETNTASRSSQEVTYFENWLEGQYGDEYNRKLITAKQYNGLRMYLKEQHLVLAERDRTYLIAVSISVVGFITSILGLVAEATLVSALGAIAGTGGMFSAGESVHTYNLTAEWDRYATITNEIGYPYGRAHKFIHYTGYHYTGTGTCNVDQASKTTVYQPSSTVYNSNDRIFEAAYDEYDRIGWQDGDF